MLQNQSKSQDPHLLSSNGRSHEQVPGNNSKNTGKRSPGVSKRSSCSNRELISRKLKGSSRSICDRNELEIIPIPCGSTDSSNITFFPRLFLGISSVYVRETEKFSGSRLTCSRRAGHWTARTNVFGNP